MAKREGEEETRFRRALWAVVGAAGVLRLVHAVSSFSVTVSVGVCGGVEEASDVELMENANKVLSKAIEAGGNMVRVF